MFKYLIICALLGHSIWAKPIGELASHLVIVTPQAQVHLEPLGKFAGPTFIHHLSPLARIAAPHEETIVYVPASAAAPVIPIEALSAHHVGRSASGTPQLKQNDQIQGIQQAIVQAQTAASSAQTAAQEGFGMIGEQLSEAAASFSPGAFFPPPPSSGSSSSGGKDEKLRERIETPANTQPLLAASGRQYIAIAAPAVPHIVDFVPGAPVLVSHISAIRARSLEDASQVPIAAPLPLEAAESKPDTLPLKSDLLSKPEEQPLKEDSLIPADREKTSDIGRFLEANALKDDSKTEKLSSLPLEQKDQEPQASSLSLNKIAENPIQQPLLKSIVDGSVVEAPKVVDPVVNDAVVAV